jgi:hypothetical protein
MNTRTGLAVLSAAALLLPGCNGGGRSGEDAAAEELDAAIDEADASEPEILQDLLEDDADGLDIAEAEEEACPCDGGCALEGREPERIQFLDVGRHGIFDPSLEAEGEGGSRIWMSYSAVEAPESPGCRDPADPASKNMQVETHQAFSDDLGATWQEAGIVNDAENFCLPFDPPRHIGTWVHEVSTLVLDPSAPAGERWKLFWHRYMVVDDDDPDTDDRLFQHGWIAMRTSPDPSAGFSAERKLMVGSLYSGDSDAWGGPPEIRLNEVFPELADCVIFTEPGTLGAEDGIYLALNCFQLPPATDGNRIVLLKLDAGGWHLAGTLLSAGDAAAFGHDRFNAAELYASSGRVFLLATPSAGDGYAGCMLFEILDPGAAEVARDADDVPVLLMTVSGTEGSFNGACGYDALSLCSGIVRGEVFPDDPPAVFRLFKTFRSYP